jgi:hypothetical protein
MVALLKPGAIRTPTLASAAMPPRPPIMALRHRGSAAEDVAHQDVADQDVAHQGGVVGLVSPRTAATAGPSASRSHLRLVESPPHTSPLNGVPVAGIAVAVAVVFGLLLAVRLIQGSPPATWAEPTADSRAPVQALAGPGDQIVVAQPGDTFWALARELAPDRDVRPVVDLLVRVNGGSSIDSGQRLIIPAELLQP